ncbi:MAG: PfkB family carbohydrate kinase [Candidatus Acidiferrales bacterium]
MKIGVIGEVLWDVIGNAEHLGGAPFNFAAHARILGHDVAFVSGVGADDRGARILARMDEMHLTTRYVARVDDQPTGYATVSVDSAGQPSFILHRPVAYHFPALAPDDFATLVYPPPDWIYFGTLTFMSEQAKSLAFRLLDAAPAARRFYDVNLRHNCYTPELLDELMGRATIVKLNDFEIDEVARIFRHPNLTFENFARAYAQKYSWQGVCITRGADGCAVLLGDDYFESPGFRVKVADAIGAGDAFAAAFVHGLSAGWPPKRVAAFANCVGALIASRTGAIPEWSPVELPPLP